ncbi:translation initiation factor IF-6 [Candidatus Woesearchaeota archaeon]|nr:translation initiation factor IF-6 [Candidatus Woesearchaeota archaeon]
MTTLIANVDGNPNIGLYAYATDEYCLVGKTVKKQVVQTIEKALKVPVHKISIAKSSLIGVLVNGNKNGLIVPQIIEKEELEDLEKLGLKITVVNSKYTALGNNLIVNDNGIIASPDYDDETVKLIEKALKVKAITMTIADVEVVGSCLAHTKKGALIHSEAEESEVEQIEKILKVEIDWGTVNMGSPYIGAAIIANSNGVVVGDASGGPEINNAEQALGLL